MDDDLLEEDEALGVEGLAMEVILEEPDAHSERKTVQRGRHRVRETVYDYDEQLEAFKEQVNAFLDDHNVYSVDTQTIEVGDDRYRNEARIIYSEA